MFIKGVIELAGSRTSFAGKVRAPKFPDGLEWINASKAVKLEDLKGRVVILDFWTYC